MTAREPGQDPYIESSHGEIILLLGHIQVGSKRPEPDATALEGPYGNQFSKGLRHKWLWILQENDFPLAYWQPAQMANDEP